MNDVISGFNIFIVNGKIRDKQSEEGALLKNTDIVKASLVLITHNQYISTKN